MTTEQIINICKERNELEFLFQITKQIAEADSIGEEYAYCSEYTKEMFNNSEMHVQPIEYKARGFVNGYNDYLEHGGIPIYKLYLKHIGAIS